MLLLTDGLANVGISDPAALTAMARKTAGSAGVGTTTIGFGEGFDEALLTAMADAGRGNAHYAPTPEAAPAIFASEFEGLMSLVAQNVSVEIRPGEDVQLLGMLNGFPQVAVGGGVQVQLGDAYGEERRRVVFQLHIAELAVLGVAKVAEVILRYVTVGEQVAMHEMRLPLTVNLVSADEAAAAEADHEVTEEVVILKSARAQTQAREHADRGEFEIARKLLSEAADDLRTTAPVSAQAEELLATAEMLGESFTSMTPATYDPSARKRMHYQSRTTSQRRKKRNP